MLRKARNTRVFRFKGRGDLPLRQAQGSLGARAPVFARLTKQTASELRCGQGDAGDRARRQDLARVAEAEPLQRGGRPSDAIRLSLSAGGTPYVTIDWDSSLDEIALPVPELYLDSVARGTEIDRRQNVARCWLLVRQAVDRRDREVALMADALDKVHGDDDDGDGRSTAT